MKEVLYVHPAESAAAVQRRRPDLLSHFGDLIFARGKFSDLEIRVIDDARAAYNDAQRRFARGG